MFWRFCVILFVGILLEWKLIQCAPVEVGKPKEKVRAYEFGYSIEENQHRHEKRDENGIVMGEFGFITADGIYHVTVYATDENGKFKILAMKSYPYANPEKKIMVAMLPPPKKPVVVPAVRKAIPLDTQSCGGCVLTKKLSPADVIEQVPEDPGAAFRPLSKTFNEAAVTTKNVPSSISPKGGPSLSSRPLVPSLPIKPNAIGSTAANGKDIQLSNFRQTGSPTVQILANRQGKTFNSNVTPQIDLRVGASPNQLTSTAKQFQTNPPSVGGVFNQPAPKSVFTSNNFQQPQQNTFRPNTATAISQQNAKESTSFQPLNKFLPNGASLLQQAGRPPALANNNALTQPQLINNLTPTGTQLSNTIGARTSTQQIPSTGKVMPSGHAIGKVNPLGNGGGPLYRFKYVLDYNSHREEGRIDGSKEGNYNTVEDGIRRVIDYIANENGFQPHIKWERVPPNELPTGENKLKEYEFVWFN